MTCASSCPTSWREPVHRTALTMLAALVAALFFTGVAGAQGTAVEEAAQALQGDPVYQDASAERKISDAELADLRRQVRGTNKPIYIAILPRSAGAPDGVVVDVARETRRRGTYGVVVGDKFRAVSNAEPQSTATAESRAAIGGHSSDGVAAVLSDFVDRTAQPGVQGPADSGGDGGGGGGGGGGGLPVKLLLLLTPGGCSL